MYEWMNQLQNESEWITEDVWFKVEINSEMQNKINTRINRNMNQWRIG